MKTLAFLLLVALIALGAWEQRSIASLREESAALRAEQAAAGPLGAEIATLEQRLSAAAPPAPEFDRSELLRLRNTVRRLRSSQINPEKLRAENERLAADLKSGNFRPPRLADQPGFVARENWANVGNATPEAALQSVLHAMRDANLDLFVTLIGDSESEAMRRELQEDPVQARGDFARGIQADFNPIGYLITGREEIPGGKVGFKVKFGARSEPVEMEFQQSGSSWKMTKGF